jgi:hypothetical protein
MSGKLITIRIVAVNILVTVGGLLETPEHRAISIYFAVTAAIIAADLFKELTKGEG